MPLTCECLDTCCSQLGEPDGFGCWLSVMRRGDGLGGGYWTEQGE